MMREVFYLVAILVMLVTVFAPEAVGSWMQAVDTARFSCDTEQCWDPEAYH
jgi:hypothetical protein